MKPRRPWLAALLDFFVPPLGHVYAGAPLRGIALFVLRVAAGVMAATLLVQSEDRGVLLGLIALVVFLMFFLPVDAIVVGRRGRRDYRLKAYNRWFVYAAVGAVIAVLDTPLRTATRARVQAFSIPSGAMLPTLQIGDHLFVDKGSYRHRAPRRFDIVVFEFPNDPSMTFIKRIVGLPGETIEVRDTVVSIDGAPLDEPHARYTGTGKGEGRRFGPQVIPEGSFFMLGDNRDESYDSRFWGPVRADKIFGRAHVIYFSGSAARRWIAWERLGLRVR